MIFPRYSSVYSSIMRGGHNMKAVFIDPIPTTFGVADVLAKMGMPQDHQFGQQIAEMMEKAATVAQPKAFYLETPIEARSNETVQIGGQIFESVALANNLSNVEQVYPFLCTCGVELAAMAETIQDPLERMAFDEVMDYYRREAVLALANDLANREDVGGQTSSMGPGSLVDWHITEQKKLFALFGDYAAKAGVELSPSSLMRPIKSVSGIRYKTSQEFHNCQLCQRENCPSRVAPFDGALFASTLLHE